MIRIYNNKLRSEISIDEQVDWIQFNPRDYEERPYIIIEMKGFDFLRHAEKCQDCKEFIGAFGNHSLDWYISYNDKVYRLDVEQIGKGEYPHNEIKYTMSEYNPGTKLTLIFHPLPTDKSELKTLLNKAVLDEKYEHACILRDLIEE